MYFAQFVKMFAQRYPDVEIVRQVMDNPNTNKEKSFYEAGSVFRKQERFRTRWNSITSKHTIGSDA